MTIIKSDSVVYLMNSDCHLTYKIEMCVCASFCVSICFLWDNDWTDLHNYVLEVVAEVQGSDS